MKRGQGAFEYILLLAGVLLIVVLAIIILRGAVPGTQVSQAQCKAQIAAISMCIDPTGQWNTTGCNAGGGCDPSIYGVNKGCLTALAGTPYINSTSNGFLCGPRPV